MTSMAAAQSIRKDAQTQSPAECRYLIPIRDLLESVHLAASKTPVKEIKEYFGDDEPIKAVVVVSGKRPIGLVMNIHLDRTLSQRFGLALYYEKPVEIIMDKAPLMVEGNMRLERVADLAMGREKSRIFDHIIITEQGEVTGIVSVQNILNRMVDIQEQYSLEMTRINERLHSEILERKTAEKELIELNQELETRVLERTERIQESNRKLKMAAESAESANRAKSVFLANMSHELRTPLNHIIGFTELVLEQHFGHLNEIQSEYLGDVVGSSKHLLSLINDILDLSKVEAGKLELDSAELDIKKLLENSLVMIKEKAMKHRIALEAKIHDVPDTIVADGRKLKQVLYNLLSNSVKFTPDGGSICLEARQVKHQPPAEDVDHKAVEGGDKEYLEIAVTDTGIGLKPEDLERIFRPFEQADSSITRKFQGTGLGLSLTKKLIELHKGRIWVESRGLGNGATFRFVIPNTRAAALDERHPAKETFLDGC